jgi:hypothetical protein
MIENFQKLKSNRIRLKEETASQKYDRRTMAIGEENQWEELGKSHLRNTK